MPTIGATGHRILAEVDKIRAGIDQALQRIGQRFPEEPLEVISPLAEGSDRLVARAVLAQPSSRLVAALPLTREDYLTDFATAESKEEFTRLLGMAAEIIELPARTTRNEAYEASGAYVLARCDVLVAVWDGRGAQGQGGTAGIVARARARKLPLAWVHAGNCQPGTTEPTSLGPEQGKVTFEDF